MKLNLPILERLQNAQNILIAGAGGGFDFLIGLPIYFTLREMGKTVHLANYTFCDFRLVSVVSEPEILLPDLVHGAKATIRIPFQYFPEGYCSQWFKEVRGEDVTIWMMAKTGVAPLHKAYQKLIDHLNIDALILVDGGVDSIMQGDESGAGTFLEDSISLAAVKDLEVPVKILGCCGFGTEVEEAVCHYNALENMAMLMKAGGFLGSCALVKEMEVFQGFEAAARYIWEQPDHHKSHISTRIIPAVQGEFGNYHMYKHESQVPLLISPLMTLYWFFDAMVVIEHNKIIPLIKETEEVRSAFVIVQQFLISNFKNLRQPRKLPY